MSAVTRFFFRTTYLAPTTRSVIGWWESRRLAYNLSVGAAGLLSIGAITLSEALAPNSHATAIPWGGVLVYGIVANLFYCFGPIVDAVVCRQWGAQYAPIGATIFRYGFVFAVALSLLPIPVAFVSLVVRVGIFLFGAAPTASL
jgi:hypothetical protein